MLALFYPRHRGPPRERVVFFRIVKGQHWYLGPSRTCLTNCFVLAWINPFNNSNLMVELTFCGMPQRLGSLFPETFAQLKNYLPTKMSTKIVKSPFKDIVLSLYWSGDNVDLHSALFGTALTWTRRCLEQRWLGLSADLDCDKALVWTRRRLKQRWFGLGAVCEKSLIWTRRRMGHRCPGQHWFEISVQSRDTQLLKESYLS